MSHAVLLLLWRACRAYGSTRTNPIQAPKAITWRVSSFLALTGSALRETNMAGSHWNLVGFLEDARLADACALAEFTNPVVVVV